MTSIENVNYGENEGDCEQEDQHESAFMKECAELFFKNEEMFLEFSSQFRKERDALAPKREERLAKEEANYDDGTQQENAVGVDDEGEYVVDWAKDKYLTEQLLLGTSDYEFSEDYHEDSPRVPVAGRVQPQCLFCVLDNPEGEKAQFDPEDRKILERVYIQARRVGYKNWKKPDEKYTQVGSDSPFYTVVQVLKVGASDGMSDYTGDRLCSCCPMYYSGIPWDADEIDD